MVSVRAIRRHLSAGRQFQSLAVLIKKNQAVVQGLSVEDKVL